MKNEHMTNEYIYLDTHILQGAYYICNAKLYSRVSKELLNLDKHSNISVVDYVAKWSYIRSPVVHSAIQSLETKS